MIEKNNILLTAINASIDAGKAILEVYRTDFPVEIKEDNSPLTAADKKSNEIITTSLRATGLPVLSEEGKEIPYGTRKDWDYYWLVDPLDGTKEFIKKNGEFTVNIALMHKQYPVGGVIYVPDKNILYFGSPELGGYKLDNATHKFENIDALMGASKKLPDVDDGRKFTIVGSKSHPSPETQEFIESWKQDKGDVDIISMGSSLKLCLVAEGAADAYPRFAPTMEWDTAAGQAVAEASGATVINWTTKSRMEYNKENLLNDWFLVERSRSLS